MDFTARIRLYLLSGRLRILDINTGVVTHSPETSVDSAASVVCSTLIFIICNQPNRKTPTFSYKRIKWQQKVEGTDEFTEILIRSLVLVAGTHELAREYDLAK